ncbi:MAG: hypothetical protein ACP5ID_00475 [Conexivisphaera sp.]
MRWPRPKVPREVARSLIPGARLEVLEPFRRPGELVVETKNMVLLDVGGKIIKVPKEGSVFMLDGRHAVPGSALVGNPAERLVRAS